MHSISDIYQGLAGSMDECLSISGSSVTAFYSQPINSTNLTHGPVHCILTLIKGQLKIWYEPVPLYPYINKI